MSTFFDVIINKGKNSFYIENIVESASELEADNSELETLKNIELVVKNQLDYDSTHQDNYSGKPRVELFNILKRKSVRICNGYHDKLSKQGFLWQLIDFLFLGKEREMKAVYKRINLYGEVMGLIEQGVIPKEHLSYEIENSQKLNFETTLQNLENLSKEDLFTILSNEKLYLPNFQKVRKIFGLKRSGEVIKDDAIKNKRSEALILSVRNGDKGISELLLQHGADPNFPASNGSAPLHFAAQAGHTEIVELLLNKGAQVNQRSASGSSALVFACRGYHVEGKYHKPNNAEVVRLLLDNGADPNFPANNGSAPLHFAAQAGHTEIVELLLNKGAQVNQQSTSGSSALVFACHGYHVKGKYHKPNNAEVVKLLLGNGADPNLSSNDGLLPLHFAAQAGSADIVELLLKKDAEVDKLALALACGYKPLACGYKLTYYKPNKEVVRLLLDNGADPSIFIEKDLTSLKIASDSLEIVSKDIKKNDLTLLEILQKNDLTLLEILQKNDEERLELIEIVLLIGEHIIPK